MIHKNEFELVFDIFPVVCLSIDNKKMSADEMKQYMKNCDDLEEFSEISQVITEIYQQIIDDQKKKSEKMTSGIKSQNETILYK